MSMKDFTSLPPEEEQQFVVFEQTSVELGKKANVLGWAIGGVIGALLFLVYLTGDPPPHVMPPDEAPVEEKKADAPKPETTKAAAAPTEEAKPAEGEAKPAEGEAKPAEGEAKPAEAEKK